MAEEKNVNWYGIRCEFIEKYMDCDIIGYLDKEGLIWTDIGEYGRRIEKNMY